MSKKNLMKKLVKYGTSKDKRFVKYAKEKYLSNVSGHSNSKILSWGIKNKNSNAINEAINGISSDIASKMNPNHKLKKGKLIGINGHGHKEYEGIPSKKYQQDFKNIQTIQRFNVEKKVKKSLTYSEKMKNRTSSINGQFEN